MMFFKVVSIDLASIGLPIARYKPDTPAEPGQRELFAQINLAMELLAPKWREGVEIFISTGNYSEVARIQSLTRAGAGARIKRTLKRLREWLRAYMNEDRPVTELSRTRLKNYLLSADANDPQEIRHWLNWLFKGNHLTKEEVCLLAVCLGPDPVELPIPKPARAFVVNIVKAWNDRLRKETNSVNYQRVRGVFEVDEHRRLQALDDLCKHRQISRLEHRRLIELVTFRNLKINRADFSSRIALQIADEFFARLDQKTTQILHFIHYRDNARLAIQTRVSLGLLTPQTATVLTEAFETLNIANPELIQDLPSEEQEFCFDSLLSCVLNRRMKLAEGLRLVSLFATVTRIAGVAKTRPLAADLLKVAGQKPKRIKVANRFLDDFGVKR